MRKLFHQTLKGPYKKIGPLFFLWNCMKDLTWTPTCSFMLYHLYLYNWYPPFHRSQTMWFSWQNHVLCQMNSQKNWKKNCHMTHPNHSMDPSLEKRRPACSCTQFLKAGGHKAFLGFSHLEVWDYRVINWYSTVYIIWCMWDIFEGKNTSFIAKQVFTNSSRRLPVQKKLVATNTNQGDLFKGVLWCFGKSSMICGDVAMQTLGELPFFAVLIKFSVSCGRRRNGRANYLQYILHRFQTGFIPRSSNDPNSQTRT